MSIVIDVKKVKLDSRNRIFVVASLAKYLGYKKVKKTKIDDSETIQTEDTKTETEDIKEVEYTIMFPEKDDPQGLILLNETMTKELIDELRRKDSAKSRLTSLKNAKNDENQKIIKRMRTSEIKTQKIQLCKSEVLQLKLDKTKMIVLDLTDVDKVRIYSEKYYKENHLDDYIRFGLGDDEDE